MRFVQKGSGGLCFGTTFPPVVCKCELYTNIIIVITVWEQNTVFLYRYCAKTGSKNYNTGSPSLPQNTNFAEMMMLQLITTILLHNCNNFRNISRYVGCTCSFAYQRRMDGQPESVLTECPSSYVVLHVLMFLL